MSHPYRPVVILGAGRSGTNMLRDVLCSLPGFGTWPCDEINYLWRHGNKRIEHDEFGPEHARPEIQRFLDRAFQACAKREACTTVVEKTCANTLRAGFVATALPEHARFLHIVRDGEDVVASAGKRWTATLDIPYLMKKARFVPKTDLPYYALRYFGARLHRLFDKEGKVSFWGPRYVGMEEDLLNRNLAEVCALQWKRCVEKCMADLDQYAADRTLHLRYEDFVAAPAQELARIGHFLQEDWSEEDCQAAVRKVSGGSVGKGARDLNAEQRDAIDAIVAPLMDRLDLDPRFRPTR
ncbi:MAG: sulfotransferase family protein [Planctomycetota bacterium]